MNTPAPHTQTLSPQHSARQITTIPKNKEKNEPKGVSSSLNTHNLLRQMSWKELQTIMEFKTTYCVHKDIQNIANNQILQNFFRKANISHIDQRAQKNIIEVLQREPFEIARNFYEEKLTIQQKKLLLKDISEYLTTGTHNPSVKEFSKNTNIPINKSTYELIAKALEEHINWEYIGTAQEAIPYLKNLCIEEVHDLYNKLENYQPWGLLDKDIANVLNTTWVSEHDIESILSPLKKVVDRVSIGYYVKHLKDSYEHYIPKVKEDASRQEEEKYEYEGGYSFIPSEEETVANVIYDVAKENNIQEKSFLDIGCGIPWISQTMKDIGCKEAAGLEYNKELVEKSKSHFPDIKIHHDDILKFFEYDKYDILYIYNPLRDWRLMTQALCHIIKNMRIWSTLYFCNVTLCGDKLIERWFEEIDRKTQGRKVFKYKKTTTNKFQKKI